MALSQKHKEIIARARRDAEFRVALLKEALRIAVAEDVDLLEKAMQRLEAKKKAKQK